MENKLIEINDKFEGLKLYNDLSDKIRLLFKHVNGVEGIELITAIHTDLTNMMRVIYGTNKNERQ